MDLIQEALVIQRAMASRNNIPLHLHGFEAQYFENPRMESRVLLHPLYIYWSDKQRFLEGLTGTSLVNFL